MSATVTSMANRLSDDNDEIGVTRGERYGSFIDRYPDYPSWLDGGTWELDFSEDLKVYDNKAALNGFRSSLHYQARQLKLNLITKTVIRRDEETGRSRRVLLVRAY